MSGLEVRQARAKDVDELVATLSEAARWLLERGIEQWPDPFPRGRVEALVRRGELFVVRLDGEPAGSLVLRWSDPSFWGEQPDDAGYVHALAVRRAYAGRGLGARLLEWADVRVVEAGREFLRLDCMAENGALRRYYEQLGFEPRGEVLVEDFVAALYERRCRASEAAAAGEAVTLSAPSGDRHARIGSVRSQRERGRTASPTLTGGGAFLTEPWPTKGAAEWRAFWREHGMRELARVLEESWAPIAAASPEERESCAFRVASLLGSRAPRGALAEELGRVRRDFGLPAAPDEDERSAMTITGWFMSAAA